MDLSDPGCIRHLIERSLARWRACETRGGAPGWGPRYTRIEQDARSARASRLLAQISRTLRHPPRSRQDYREIRRKAEAEGLAFLDGVLGIDRGQSALLNGHGFGPVTRLFVREARRFDPALTGEQIYQAVRNAWVIAALQVLLGGRARFTPAVLGYSLLYPYTDNLLDDPRTSAEQKRSFNTRLGRRLEDGRGEAAGDFEMRVHACVGMIERTYPRRDHPQVRAALLAIHAAQIRSLRLHGRPGLASAEVLEISFEKGGASVMADGSLAFGALTAAQAQSCFDYGAFLQLQDDLHDIAADQSGGITTLFTQGAGNGPLDALADHLARFGQETIAAMGGRANPLHADMRALMQRSAILLLQQAAASSPERFSAAWLERLERHSPLSFEAWRRLTDEVREMSSRLRATWGEARGMRPLAVSRVAQGVAALGRRAEEIKLTAGS